MEKFLYTCHYCSKEYLPRRRHKQLYCSSSCRTRAYIIRKGKKLITTTNISTNKEEKKPDAISWTGVANAALGTLAINGATKLFTKDEDKPVTKKDLKNLMMDPKQRYHPVKNISPRHDGKRPFYDIKTQSIQYLTIPSNHGPKQY